MAKITIMSSHALACILASLNEPLCPSVTSVVNRSRDQKADQSCKPLADRSFVINPMFNWVIAFRSGIDFTDSFDLQRWVDLQFGIAFRIRCATASLTTSFPA